MKGLVNPRRCEAEGMAASVVVAPVPVTVVVVEEDGLDEEEG
jgi:hypothetical protein